MLDDESKWIMRMYRYENNKILNSIHCHNVQRILRVLSSAQRKYLSLFSCTVRIHFPFLFAVLFPSYYRLFRLKGSEDSNNANHRKT